MEFSFGSKHSPSYGAGERHSVAIVGMAIQAPSGKDKSMDTDELWDFLKERRSAITLVPPNRWNAAAFHGSGPGQTVTKGGAFIKDIGYTDPQEFGISMREASQMSPLQLHSLHVAFDALQRSGIDYRGSNTGVYMGCAHNTFNMEEDHTAAGEYYMTGKSLSLVPNRISYIFDLLGPSLPVDTACSSSLVAMHLAVQAIRNGDCDQAIVGGVNFMLAPIDTAAFSRLGVLSPDGISKAFDDEANGYARGEVVSAVIIKRHDLAVMHNNHIHATVVGTALTSCGSIMGSITTPSPVAQTQAIRKAFADAQLKPSQADFIELHGTGTPIGDSIEANVAGKIFSEDRGGREILIGSIKSNIGHGEMGAFMSSLIKVVMMLEQRQILPNGYYSKPSTKIHFDAYKLRVPTSVEEFIPQNPTLGLIASISSYGFGGSCGHTVIREHDSRPPLTDYIDGSALHGPFLFAVGGLSPRACKSLTQAYQTTCTDTPPASLSEHMGSRARQLSWRSFAIAHSVNTALFTDPQVSPKRPPHLVICFSGQGPQHLAMGTQLYRRFSEFRKSVLLSDAVYREYTGTSFIASTGLFSQPETKLSINIDDQKPWAAPIISVAITMFQVALFDLLSYFGIRADAVIGHSIGETAALYASGAMPRKMVIQIAVARGKALAIVEGAGGMLAVSGCDKETLEGLIGSVSFLESFPEGVASLSIATVNSPRDFGVSGLNHSIEVLYTFIRTWFPAIKATKLRVSTAVHSPYMDPCESMYRAELEQIFSQSSGTCSPRIPVVSTVTGDFVRRPFDIDYLWSNLRSPVLFSRAVTRLIEKFGQETTFLEISPHPVLSHYVTYLGASTVISASRRPNRDAVSAIYPAEIHIFLSAIGQLLVAGINSINFARLNGCPPSRPIFSPEYPWRKTVFPFAPRSTAYFQRLLPPSRPLNSPLLRIGPHLPESWMGEHVIDHSNIVPAAAYIEMALEFPDVTGVWDCAFETAFHLNDSLSAGTLQVSKEGDVFEVRSSTQLQALQGNQEHPRNGTQFDIIHARGKLIYGVPELGTKGIKRIELGAILDRCPLTFEKEELNAQLAEYTQFGPQFQRINRSRANDTECVSWIRGPVDLNADRYVFHPAMMDAVFQTIVSWICQMDCLKTGTSTAEMTLPHSLTRGFRNTGHTSSLSLPDEFVVYSRLTDWTPRTWVMDCYVLDEEGVVLFTFEGLSWLRRVMDSNKASERFTEIWQPMDIPINASSEELRGLETMDANKLLYLFQGLDASAIKYARKMLASLPPNPSHLSWDRQRYVSWGQDAAKLPENHDMCIRQDYGPLWDLTERVGSNMRGICQDSSTTIDILFRDNIMTAVYECPPFTGFVFDAYVERVLQVLQNVRNSGKRVIRVLEIGAGTGRLTSLLGKALVQSGIQEHCYVEYVCTDVSIALAQEASHRSPWPTTTASSFDVTGSRHEDSTWLNSFDIVLGFDVLHAIPDIPRTLRILSDLMVSGGYLAVIELDGAAFEDQLPGSVWMDFIFGGFREWFGVLKDRPEASHCTLNRAQWQHVLALSGYSQPLWIVTEVPTISHMAYLCQKLEVQKSWRDNLSLKSLAPQTAVGREDTIFKSFRAGDEVPLVNFIGGLDATRGLLIWLYTDTTPANLALLGLVRSIRHEFTLWKVHVALFDPSWSLETREAFMKVQLSRAIAEPEIMVDSNGHLRVSKIVAMPESDKFQLAEDSPIAFNDRSAWSVFLSSLKPLEVQVKVKSIVLNPMVEGLAEFAGEITTIGASVPPDYIEPGTRVFGVTPCQNATVISCPYDHVAAIPPSLGFNTAASVVGRLAFGNLLNSFMPYPLQSPFKVVLHFGTGGSAAITAYKILKNRSIELLVTVYDLRYSELFQDEMDRGRLFKAERIESWSMALRDWCPSGIPLAITFDMAADLMRETGERLSSTGSLICVRTEQGSIKSSQTLKGSQQLILLDMLHLMSYPQGRYSSLVVSENLRDILIPDIQVVTIEQLLSIRHRQIPSSTSMRSSPTVTLVDTTASTAKLRVLKRGNDKASGLLDPCRTYILIGGTGGLGMTVACCLVEHGACHLILTSRSGNQAYASKKPLRENLMLKYLRKIPGVTVDVVALDCLNECSTRELFSRTNCAGVIFLSGDKLGRGTTQMPVQLADGLFLNMTTQRQWTSVYDIKVKGLEVLLRAVKPESLDFLVLTSSMATVCGSPGQANYVAAQTYMEALAATIPKCIAVAVPPIIDGGIFVRSMPQNSRNAALEKYLHFGMTAVEVAQSCMDAISLASSGSTSLYIPSTNWQKMDHIIPRYAMGRVRHLYSQRYTRTFSDSAITISEQTIKAACGNVLSLSPQDIEDDVPLSAYGLDSLTSVRLSTILKATFDVSLTQLQLLNSNMTVAQLRKLYEQQQAVKEVVNASNASSDGVTGSNTSEMLLSDLARTVVLLNGRTQGPPLFIVHGAGGGILVFQKLAQRIHVPVYGVQDTQDAPISSTLPHLAQFYLKKIREIQPRGPYHLAGFSLGTLIVSQVVQEIRISGDCVANLVMLDGTPTLFQSKTYQEYAMAAITSGSLREEILFAVADMSVSCALDDAEHLPEEFSDYFDLLTHGKSRGPPWILRFCSAYAAHILMAVRFSRTPGCANSVVGPWSPWPAKRTVLVRADRGIASATFAAGASEVFDFENITDDVELHVIGGSHFGILGPDSGLAGIFNDILGV